jgi:hypothetical protein
MGIELSSFNDKQLAMMPATTRKQFGKAGLTNAECLTKETIVLERKLHDQFKAVCVRNGVNVIHSNPVRKSSIASGQPDFNCSRNGRCIHIEFKIWPNKLSKEQEQRIISILSNGDPTFVVTETPTHSALKEAIDLLIEYLDLKLTKEDQ